MNCIENWNSFCVLSLSNVKKTLQKPLCFLIKDIQNSYHIKTQNENKHQTHSREIGGKIYPGEVNEKKVAQKRYDEAKKKGQSAGQVKQK